jgi:hypothetical protein
MFFEEVYVAAPHGFYPLSHDPIYEALGSAMEENIRWTAWRQIEFEGDAVAVVRPKPRS